MAKKGFSERLKALLGLRGVADEEFYEELADGLVEGDLGASEAFELVEELRDACRKERISDGQAIRLKLVDLFVRSLTATKSVASLEPGRLGVILLLGVNGVGKTTTAAKLADLYRSAGRKPILAAADTFRAAAIDQLKIHGDRLGLRVVAHKHGGDPAAVVYDAIDAALAGGGDLIIADTAGRMHTKSGLVDELKKIDRIVSGKAADCTYLKYLVLDATTGRNAMAQAEIFHDAVKLDGAILTKYDSTARGGIAFSLARALQLSTRYVCVGERYADIIDFEPERYAREFIGLE